MTSQTTITSKNHKLRKHLKLHIFLSVLIIPMIFLMPVFFLFPAIAFLALLQIILPGIIPIYGIAIVFAAVRSWKTLDWKDKLLVFISIFFSLLHALIFSIFINLSFGIGVTPLRFEVTPL